MKLKSMILALCIIFLMCEQGYCLFPDTVSSQQVSSALKIQRAKDEQRKKIADKEKKEKRQKEKLDKKNTGSGAQTYSSSAKKSKTTAAQELGQKTIPMPQYKRHTPQGTIVNTPQPKSIEPIVAEQEQEKKKSRGGFIFLLVVLATIGVMHLKQKKK